MTSRSCFPCSVSARALPSPPGLLLALALAAGCGGPVANRASGGGSGSTVVVNTVVIAFTGDPDRLPFDPRAARLQAATQQLTAIAGHAVTFQFDIALLPEWRSSFEEALTSAIENVARDLDAIRSRRPDLDAFAGRTLERVECRYVAVPTDDDLAFDPERRTLRIALTSQASSLVGDGWLFRAADGAYFTWLEKRYAGVEPERADDPALYFHYLNDYRRSESDAESRAHGVSLVARIYPRLGGEPRGKAQKWLADHVGFFTDAYRNPMPKGPLFHAAETDWVAWLKTDLPRLSDDLRDDVTRRLVVERDDPRPGETFYRTDTFPGFDVLGYGLGVLDQWAAAGHPMRNEDHPQGFLSFIYFVCPGPRDAGGHHSSSFACDHALYRLAADRDASLQRLATFLLARKDPAFVETAFVNFTRMHDAYTPMLTLWRALEAQPRAWEIATRIVAEQVSESRDSSALQDEAQRQWRALPSERGAVLYLLSQIEHERYGAIAWKDFARNFGDLASASDFAAFLDQDDAAFWNAHEVWEALSRGWSRAAALTARLDGYLDRQRATSGTPQAIDALGRIVARMCDEKAAGDLALLHAWAQKRAAARVSDQRDLEPIVFRTTPGKCTDM
jgi:hypothetical protein